MRFRQIIREYFSFSKSERTGLTILIVLMVILLITDRLVFYLEKPQPADQEKFAEMLEALKRQEVSPVEGSLFAFDPNTIDSVTLVRLALPTQVKQNLLKYRSRGGRFRAKKDVRRIYGMNDSVYKQIEAFLDSREPGGHRGDAAIVPDRRAMLREADETAGKPDPFPRTPRVEINRAVAGDLEKLYGIGPVLSDRIVKYRNLLGGFYSLTQLSEVYGLSADVLDGVLPYLEVDSSALILLNINFANARELVRHPYLKWDDARRIIRYREKGGFIEDKFHLRRDSVLNDEVFKKIAPYLQTAN